MLYSFTVNILIVRRYSAKELFQKKKFQGQAEKNAPKSVAGISAVFVAFCHIA